MTLRLSSKIQDLLGEYGIEVLPTLAGTKTSAFLNLIDPSLFPLVSQRLRVAGFRTKRTGITSFEVSTDSLRVAALTKISLKDVKSDELIDEESQKDFDSLIASWREFAKRSSEAGYRKACKAIQGAAKRALPGSNHVEAARQIAQETFQLAKSSGSKSLRKLATVLSEAAKKGDHVKIAKILTNLSSSKTNIKIYSPSVLKKMSSKNFRKAELKNKQDPNFIKACRAIQLWVTQQGLEPDEINDLSQLTNEEPYQSWYESLDSDEQEAAPETWSAAVSQVLSDQSKMNGQNSTEFPRTSSAWSENCGFLVDPSMDIKPRLAAYDIIDITEQLIESYTPKHPADLTKDEVKRFLREDGYETSSKLVDKVCKALFKITNQGIPDRTKDEPKSKEANMSDSSSEIAAVHQTTDEYDPLDQELRRLEKKKQKEKAPRKKRLKNMDGEEVDTETPDSTLKHETVIQRKMDKLEKEKIENPNDPSQKNAIIDSLIMQDKERMQSFRESVEIAHKQWEREDGDPATEPKFKRYLPVYPPKPDDMDDEEAVAKWEKQRKQAEKNAISESERQEIREQWLEDPHNKLLVAEETKQEIARRRNARQRAFVESYMDLEREQHQQEQQRKLKPNDPKNSPSQIEIINDKDGKPTQKVSPLDMSSVLKPQKKLGPSGVPIAQLRLKLRHIYKEHFDDFIQAIADDNYADLVSRTLTQEKVAETIKDELEDYMDESLRLSLEKLIQESPEDSAKYESLKGEAKTKFLSDFYYDRSKISQESFDATEEQIQILSQQLAKGIIRQDPILTKDREVIFRNPDDGKMEEGWKFKHRLPASSDATLYRSSPDKDKPQDMSDLKKSWASQTKQGSLPFGKGTKLIYTGPQGNQLVTASHVEKSAGDKKAKIIVITEDGERIGANLKNLFPNWEKGMVVSTPSGQGVVKGPAEDPGTFIVTFNTSKSPHEEVIDVKTMTPFKQVSGEDTRIVPLKNIYHPQTPPAKSSQGYREFSIVYRKDFDVRGKDYDTRAQANSGQFNTFFSMVGGRDSIKVGDVVTVWPTKENPKIAGVIKLGNSTDPMPGFINPPFSGRVKEYDKNKGILLAPAGKADWKPEYPEYDKDVHYTHVVFNSGPNKERGGAHLGDSYFDSVMKDKKPSSNGVWWTPSSFPVLNEDTGYPPLPKNTPEDSGWVTVAYQGGKETAEGYFDKDYVFHPMSKEELPRRPGGVVFVGNLPMELVLRDGKPVRMNAKGAKTFKVRCDRGWRMGSIEVPVVNKETGKILLIDPDQPITDENIETVTVEGKTEWLGYVERKVPKNFTRKEPPQSKGFSKQRAIKKDDTVVYQEDFYRVSEVPDPGSKDDTYVLMDEDGNAYRVSGEDISLPELADDLKHLVEPVHETREKASQYQPGTILQYRERKNKKVFMIVVEDDGGPFIVMKPLSQKDEDVEGDELDRNLLKPVSAKELEESSTPQEVEETHRVKGPGNQGDPVSITTMEGETYPEGVTLRQSYYEVHPDGSRHLIVEVEQDGQVYGPSEIQSLKVLKLVKPQEQTHRDPVPPQSVKAPQVHTPPSSPAKKPNPLADGVRFFEENGKLYTYLNGEKAKKAEVAQVRGDDVTLVIEGKRYFEYVTDCYAKFKS